MKLIALADYIGANEPLSPERMLYTTRPATSCHGCLFQHQRSTVCHRATAAALRAGLEDCDAGFVYVTVLVDPRQSTVFDC